MQAPVNPKAVYAPAAIFPVQDRAFLRITGPDATRWLNGMVTNNIRDLAAGEGNYNFILNAQGRIEGDCTIYRSGTVDAPEFILSTAASQIETLEPLLERFIIMDDVELSRVFYMGGIIPPQRGLGVTGQDASSFLLRTLQLLNQSFTSLPAHGHMQHDRTGDTPLVVFAPPTGTAEPYFEVWSQSGLQLDLIRQNLLSMGALQLNAHDVEAHRILAGQPRYGVDIRNNEVARDLPQETAQAHALNFNKGCYLGQEIVERIHSRGNVHRAFTRFTLTGTMPVLPAPLYALVADQTKPAGELTSAIDIDGSLHALGYLRREFATQPLTYVGGTATPQP